jgi:hypothetical protein
VVPLVPPVLVVPPVAVVPPTPPGGGPFESSSPLLHAGTSAVAVTTPKTQRHCVFFIVPLLASAACMKRSRATRPRVTPSRIGSRQRRRALVRVLRACLGQREAFVFPALRVAFVGAARRDPAERLTSAF